MRLTDKPHHSPYRCAAVPFIGQTSENARWVDTGAELDREHVYLSDHAVREAMKVLGFPAPEEHDALSHQATRLSARVIELEAKLTEQQSYIDSIDVLASAGFRARKKPGRPKRDEEVAA